jgi:hypothetical protein
MTHKEWKELTPHQKRIKVAELDGYSSISDPTDEWVASYEDNIGDLPFNAMVGRRNHTWLDLVPDYLNDLNAIQEAIENLDGPTGNLFIAALIEVTGAVDGYARCLINATAEQRAEAFVLTMEGTL